MATHPYTRLFPGNVVAPDADNDTSEGFEVGDIWIDETGGAAYVALDVTDGAAVWQEAGGSGSMPNPFALTADISPAALTADVDNYNPTGLGTADVLRLTTDGSDYSINGLVGGSDGRILIILNVSAGNIITLADEAGTSTAGNRFALTIDIPIFPNRAVIVIYDATLSRWREVASTDAATVQGALFSANLAAAAEGYMLVFTSGGYFEAVPSADVVDGYLLEAIQDAVGAMFSGNTETGITATYEDSDGTIDLVVTGGSSDGWTAGTGTWSYSSADAPTFVASVPDADAANLTVGDRFKLTQTTVKYFIVTAIGSPSGGFTPITIYGGTDYTLANAAITSPYYSHAKSPVGFPVDPSKWTVTVTDSSDRSKASPVQNTIYYADVGSINISIPIGAWVVEWTAALWASSSAAQTSVGVRAALSTANNSITDTDFIGFAQNNMPSGSLGTGQSVQISKLLVLAAKTTYYLVAMTPYTGGSSITFYGSSIKPTKIRAVCAYL